MLLLCACKCKCKCKCYSRKKIEDAQLRPPLDVVVRVRSGYGFSSLPGTWPPSPGTLWQAGSPGSPYKTTTKEGTGNAVAQWFEANCACVFGGALRKGTGYDLDRYRRPKAFGVMRSGRCYHALTTSAPMGFPCSLPEVPVPQHQHLGEEFLSRFR